VRIGRRMTAAVTAASCGIIGLGLALPGPTALAEPLPVLAVRAAGAPAAPAVVLVNQPARTICSGHKFTVGVWYQRISGGSRAYRIAVSGPRHVRFFRRHGLAPASRWRFWKVLAGRAGKYHISYFGHRPGSAAWTAYRAVTVARRCRA